MRNNETLRSPAFHSHARNGDVFRRPQSAVGCTGYPVQPDSRRLSDSEHAYPNPSRVQSLTPPPPHLFSLAVDLHSRCSVGSPPVLEFGRWPPLPALQLVAAHSIFKYWGTSPPPTPTVPPWSPPMGAVIRFHEKICGNYPWVAYTPSPSCVTAPVQGVMIIGKPNPTSQFNNWSQSKYVYTLVAYWLEKSFI